MKDLSSSSDSVRLCRGRTCTSTPITLPHGKNSTGVSFVCLSGSTPVGRRMTRTNTANWTLRVLAPISITLGVGACWISLHFLLFFAFHFLKSSVVFLSGMRRKLVVAILWWTPCYEWGVKERCSLWTASPLRLTWRSASAHWMNGWIGSAWPSKQVSI